MEALTSTTGKTDAEVRAELQWEPTGIPKRLWGRKLTDVRDDSKQVAFLQRWLRDYPERHAMGEDGLPMRWDGLGLGGLLYGPPGTGKTTLACALLTSFRLIHRQSIFFTRWDDYVTARQSLSSSDNWNDDKLAFRFRAVENAAVVVLDDVGHEYSTASRYAERLLDRTFRSRFDSGKPTFATTNLTQDEWTKRYDETLTSFIGRACSPVFFSGDVE